MTSTEVISLDKAKVISAYRKGLLSLQECAQILGLELCPMERCVEEWRYDREFRQQYEWSYAKLLSSVQSEHEFIVSARSRFDN